MTYTTKLLMVDDEHDIQSLFCDVITKTKRVIVETASSGMEALKRLESYPADVVIADVAMPKMSGVDLMIEIKRLYPDTPVILITAYASVENAVEAMKQGAYDYIKKPLDFMRIQALIEKINAQKLAQRRSPLLEEEGIKDFHFENLIGQDQKMLKVYEIINQVALTNISVLITGESGTGKELIAEAIHFRSQRRSRPLITLNCAALTEGLINSELFGHEKGSFTGAIVTKKGNFEIANGGTIFLDEIGDVPISTQISLLRILETGTFRRVGGTETIKVDTRVICATNRDLMQEIREGRFREDLYYRINVVRVNVPALRERKSDIPVLANYFLRKSCIEIQRHIDNITDAAMKILEEYYWPGNVRELSNVIKSAVLFCKGKEIAEENIPEHIRNPSQQEVCTISFPSKSLPSLEASLISKVLEEKNWNVKKAAEELNVARGTIYNKMKKYGLSKN